MATPTSKVECVNPNTGGKLNIDAKIYDLFVTAIKQTLKGNKSLTFNEVVEDIKKYFTAKKIAFKGSVGWYAVTVKNDLEVKGVIDVFTEKGKKLHRLKK